MTDTVLTGPGIKEDDPIADLINGAVKGVIFDIILKLIIQRIIAKIPFLGLPIINPIFGWIAGMVAKEVYEELERFIRFQVTDFRVEKQRIAYDESVAAIKEELKKPKDQQDAESIEAARAKMADTLRDLISLKEL